MKTIEFNVNTRERSQFVNITAQVQSALAGVKEGVVTVFVPHTTAGVTINENADPDVVSDMLKALERLVPWNGPYAHCEGNSAAHLKASLVGASVQVAITNERLKLGTWQGIFFCEFDGPRNRKVQVFIP